MDPAETQRALHRHLCAWAEQDLRREIATGFLLVRPVLSRGARFLVGALLSVEGEERDRLAGLLVRQFWGDAQARASTELMRLRTEAVNFEAESRPWPPRRPRLDRRRLARALRAALPTVAGPLDEEWSEDGSLYFRREVAGWTVLTSADTTGSYSPLRYQHLLWLGRGSRRREGQPWTTIALASSFWVASETSWDEFGDEEAPAAVQALTSLCAHFLEQLPSILDGLSPSPP